MLLAVCKGPFSASGKLQVSFGGDLSYNDGDIAANGS
jgi:hypothetical protein